MYCMHARYDIIFMSFAVSAVSLVVSLLRRPAELLRCICKSWLFDKRSYPQRNRKLKLGSARDD